MNFSKKYIQNFRLFFNNGKFKGKILILIIYQKRNFFGFCCLFLKTFVKISDTFQWVISREKLMPFQLSTIRMLYDPRKCLNENPQKHDFFLHHFRNFFKKIPIFRFFFLNGKFKGKISIPTIYQKRFFSVFVVSFWRFLWK